MTEMRLRSRVAPEVLESMRGKILTENDFDVLLRGPSKVLKPDGKPLAVYLPGALDVGLMNDTYPILHSLKSMTTDNRGDASGTQRVKYNEASTRTRSKLVASAVVGNMDPGGAFRYCRLTAWSGKELEPYRGLFPLFEAIGDLFAEHVPDRYAIQMGHVNRTHPDWHIGRTPFTTITVNNTYPTGVHTDAGDLEEGFSTLACLRRGEYTGGNLVFPEFRVAVDMRHGDLLLMDAHEWHGNVALQDLTPECDWCAGAAKWRVTVKRPDTGKTVEKPICDDDLNKLSSQNVQIISRSPVLPMERISVVSYFRTKMVTCGSAEEEAAKAARLAEQKSGGILDEMAAESMTAPGTPA